MPFLVKHVCMCACMYMHHVYMCVYCTVLLFSLIVFHIQVEAPFIPKTEGAGDTSNFEECDEEPLRMSSTEKYVSEFADF